MFINKPFYWFIKTIVVFGVFIVMPEGEKHWGCKYIVISGHNLPSPVGIGLTDLPNINGLGSGITAAV